VLFCFKGGRLLDEAQVRVRWSARRESVARGLGRCKQETKKGAEKERERERERKREKLKRDFGVPRAARLCKQQT
jgi:hypothetical protein